MGQVLVDLQDDDVGLLDDALGDAGAAGEVEKAVAVHGRHAQHGDVDRQKMAVVGLQIAEDHGDIAAESAVAELSLVGGAVPAVVAEMLPGRVGLDGHDRPEAEISPDLHIIELVPAPGQGRVQKGRKADIGPVIDPVPALYQLNSLVGGFQFSFIFRVKIHMAVGPPCRF